MENKTNNKRNFKKNFKKPRKQKHVPEELSRDSLRKKIRDTKRLLRKDTLDANVRQELERSLKAYEIEFENKSKITAKINVEEKYSEKYKFVKFLEFKKANKNFTKTKNQLAKLNSDADPNKRQELEKQLEKYILDLNYIEHFPKDQKYISLYPKSVLKNENIIKKRDSIRSSIQQAVKSGELLDVSIPRNRNVARKSLIKSVNSIEQNTTSNKSKKGKKETNNVKDVTMNDDFFNTEGDEKQDDDDGVVEDSNNDNDDQMNNNEEESNEEDDDNENNEEEEDDDNDDSNDDEE